MLIIKVSNPQESLSTAKAVKTVLLCTEQVGIDGGKLVKGRKRFYITDTLGNLLDSFVVSANSYDGTTAVKYWNTMFFDNELLQNVKLVFADGTFGGTFRKQMEKKYNISVDIPKIPIAQKGKIEIHEKRWIVERTIAWTLNNRRCSKDYERKTQNANAFILITNIRRLIRKI